MKSRTLSGAVALGLIAPGLLVGCVQEQQGVALQGLHTWTLEPGTWIALLTLAPNPTAKIQVRGEEQPGTGICISAVAPNEQVEQIHLRRPLPPRSILDFNVVVGARPGETVVLGAGGENAREATIEVTSPSGAIEVGRGRFLCYTSADSYRGDAEVEGVGNYMGASLDLDLQEGTHAFITRTSSDVEAHLKGPSGPFWNASDGAFNGTLETGHWRLVVDRDAIVSTGAPVVLSAAVGSARYLENS